MLTRIIDFSFGTALSSFILWELMTAILPKQDEVDKEANDYFPVQSPSELAAGHPIVGVA